MKNLILILAVLFGYAASAQFNKFKIPKKPKEVAQKETIQPVKSQKIVTIPAEQYYEKALDYKSRGLWTYALENIDNAVRLDPANLSYRELRVHALFAKGHYDRCVEDLNFMIEAGGGNATIYYILGKVEEEWGYKSLRRSPTAKKSMLDENKAYNAEIKKFLSESIAHHKKSLAAFRKALELGYGIEKIELSTLEIERLEWEIQKIQ